MRGAFLFSGRGSNLDVLLGETRGGLLDGLVEATVAITDRPGAAGLAVAARHGVPRAVVSANGLSREQFDQLLLAMIEGHEAELVVLAGFMRILSPAVVRAFSGRILNIHPADTRAHQGLHGYRWAHEQKLAETWVTVHLVDEGLDTGRVLWRAPVDLAGATSEAEIERRGLVVEHDVYRKAIAAYVHELTQKGTPLCAAFSASSVASPSRASSCSASRRCNIGGKTRPGWSRSTRVSI